MKLYLNMKYVSPTVLISLIIVMSQQTKDKTHAVLKNDVYLQRKKRLNIDNNNYNHYTLR